ncbi:AraC family transcriptional regulator [Limibacter armeniacum]|uniref:helix-turn-helix domain-containing protein n=1 Tax=Limibacter armeniacum TaxID=466084 RepID=UPI002FE65BD7
MITFKTIAEFNEYVGLPKPVSEDIDVGFYEGNNLKLTSSSVAVDFYRISIKSDFYPDERFFPNAEELFGKTIVFFNSPEKEYGWNVKKPWKGLYLQLSKKFLHEHRYLFQNYMEYGEHEALFLNQQEADEIKTIFDFIISHSQQYNDRSGVVLSYVQVLVSLVENFYKRQFSTNIQKYNRIVMEFQVLLNTYYDHDVKQQPSVQYFADNLDLTSNYLGDIIKHHTGKSAIATIHEYVIKKATSMIKEGVLNNSEIAYELGFEYPNYFAKVFKKYTRFSPNEYRKNLSKISKV